MKKLLLLATIVALAGCTKYNETGLVCADAEHLNSNDAQITLDVHASDTKADVVVNGEKIKLKSQGKQGDNNYIEYYGTNAAGEEVKLDIVFPDNAPVYYMLGIDSNMTTYGCYKK